MRDRLKEKPYPLFVFADGVIPAASVWTGSRLWVEAFRGAGLQTGDRVVIALPPCAAWLQVFVAAVWGGLTLALIPATDDGAVIDATISALDAKAAICFLDDDDYFNADAYAGALSVPDRLRITRHAPTPDARFLLRTSGTSAAGGRWIALSDAGVLSVADSHLPRLGLVEAESRVLSVLPWSHAFGLVIDLLPAIFAGAEIHRDEHGGRDVPALLDTFAQTGITDCAMVPLTAKRLAATSAGRDFVRGLRGGVVGGAPVDEALTDLLRTTNLRVGYGQTEASPGIALGQPGHFPAPRYLGQALGCETRVDAATGTLYFRGDNACVGTWNPATGYEPFDPGTWRDTGDIVTRTDTGELFFHGRADSAFKLANGRRIEAEPLENRLRAAFPGVAHVLVSLAPDSESVAVVADVPLDVDAVRAALGSVGKLVSDVRTAPVFAFVLTAKGTMNRAATAQTAFA